MIEPGEHLDRLASQVIGAAIEVHRALGPGYLEVVYEEALCIELETQKIPFMRQYPIYVEYHGRRVGESRLDILVDNCLIVELKAVETLLPVHKAQVMSYLKAANLQLGLLMNFNVVVLKQGINRVVLSSKRIS